MDLFKDVKDVEAVRYHSLHVTLQNSRGLEELAWADDPENGRVVMALKHKSKPFWAVQYHPESVRTSGGGSEVMNNFCKLASGWNQKSRRETLPWDLNAEEFFGSSWPESCLSQPLTAIPRQLSTTSGSKPRKVITRSLPLPELTSISVAENFHAINEQEPFVLLDSSSQPGRYSIIGVPSPISIRLQYHNGDDYVTVYENERPSRCSLNGGDIWAWTSQFMNKFLAIGGNESVPFWGGLVGHISYELACNTVDHSPSGPHHRDHQTHPDINLMMVETIAGLTTQHRH
jgi:para-aminobenzoate synthetase